MCGESSLPIGVVGAQLVERPDGTLSISSLSISHDIGFAEAGDRPGGVGADDSQVQPLLSGVESDFGL